MCLNFVQGGGCYVTGGRCLMGTEGSFARNELRECELHGEFDVWVKQDDGLLVTDLGFPSEEPKQCVALGVNQELALKIAGEKSQILGTSVSTSQRKCLRCARSFWISDHAVAAGLGQIGRGYFCPDCIGKETEEGLAERLGNLRYWCG